MNTSDNLRGAGLMVTSMVAFAINDAAIKSLGGTLPLFQTLFIRTIFVVVALFILVSLRSAWRPQGLSSKDKVVMWARAVTEVGAAFFIVSALFNMELANMTAILQILPLTVPLAAHLFLKETLGWRRLAAIGLGFIGMLLIVQPAGDGFTVFSLYALGGVVCVTGRDIFARMLGGKVPAQLLSFQAASMVCIFSGVAAIFEDWNAVTPFAWSMLVLSAMCITLGYIVSALVMRFGDVGFTAQFRYTGLIAALILGYVFFDEWPNTLTIWGAILIVATGLFILHRERHSAMR